MILYCTAGADNFETKLHTYIRFRMGVQNVADIFFYPNHHPFLRRSGRRNSECRRYSQAVVSTQRDPLGSEQTLKR